MELIMKKLVVLILLLFAAPTYAATGDTLFSCDFTESGATPQAVVQSCGTAYSKTVNFSGTLASATIPATGGHDNGKYLSFAYDGSGELYDTFVPQGFNKQEVTVDYWEAFSAIPAGAIWNMKSIRVYSGGNSWIGGLMSMHNASRFTTGNYTASTMTITDKVTNVFIGTDYCALVSGNTYSCKIYAEAGWTPGFTAGVWHNIRAWFKMPSGSSASDGEMKLWIDSELIYSLTGITNANYDYTNGITQISFHPSDDFQTGGSALNHMYDDITVYEGYVPPGDTPPTPTGSLRPGVSAAGVTFR